MSKDLRVLRFMDQSVLSSPGAGECVIEEGSFQNSLAREKVLGVWMREDRAGGSLLF